MKNGINFTSVQISYVDEPGKSAGQLCKLELFKSLNNEK